MAEVAVEHTAAVVMLAVRFGAVEALVVEEAAAEVLEALVVEVLVVVVPEDRGKFQFNLAGIF